MQITQAVTTDQAGETDADACSATHSGDTMEVLPEAHGHSSKQHEPPETCRKKLARMTEEKRSVPVRQHFVLPNAQCLFLTVSSSFIVQEGSRFHH